MQGPAQRRQYADLEVRLRCRPVNVSGDCAEKRAFTLISPGV
jgi:hypothetical protein